MTMNPQPPLPPQGPQYPQGPFPPGPYPPPGPFQTPFGMPPAAPTPGPQSRQYSLISGITRCLSPNLWRDAGRNWRGFGFWLMVLLLLLTTLPIAVSMEMNFASFLANDSEGIIRQIPQITIRDGVVSIDKPSPFTIKDPETGQLLAIIDTTGQTTDLPPHQMLPFVLLTRDHLIVRRDANQTQITDLRNFSYFYMDASTTRSFLQTIKSLIIPAMLVFLLVYRLLQMLIMALIGLIYNSTFDAKLSFGALMRLSIIAVVPVTLIDTVLSFLGLNLGCGWHLGSIVLNLVLLGAAVKANSTAAASPPGGYPMSPAWPTPPPPPPTWPQ